MTSPASTTALWGTAAALDDHYGVDRFWITLSARIVLPSDRAERTTVWRGALAGLAAGVPLTAAVAAAVDPAVPAGSAVDWICCVLPGIFLTAWVAHAETPARRLTAATLCQAGATRREAALITHVRVVASAAVGALLAAATLWLTHTPLAGAAADRAPLRGLLAVSGWSWLAGGVGAVLAVSAAAVLGGHLPWIRAALSARRRALPRRR
jgi:hypothetical protein